MRRFTKPSQVLAYARKCVSYGHARGAFARGRSGVMVGARQPSAVCWCVSGGIERSTSDSLLASDAHAYLMRVAGCMTRKELHQWSDRHSTVHVLAVMRIAQRMAEQDGR